MKIRKPAFIIALTLCLVTALCLPQAALTADAASVVKISSAAGLTKALTGSKSATYKLTSDISGIKKQITVKSGTKTLDLNGHIIKGSSKTSLIYVNGGSLTVKSSASGGKLYNTNSSGDAAGCGKGSLKVGSGTLQGKSYGIYQNGGTVSVTGGSVKATGSNGIAMYMTGSAKTSAKISGGTFTGTKQAIAVNVGKCTVSGGIFTGKGSTAVDICPVSGSVVFEMTGGKAVTKVKAAAAMCVQNKTALSITGGDFVNEKGGMQLQISKNFTGKKEIAEGIFDSDSVNDETPDTKDLIATSFERNSTKYSRGMTVTDPDDLYSMYMDACENLETEIKFSCSKKLYDVFVYYAADWSSGMTGTQNVKGNVAADGNADVTVTISYTLKYKVTVLDENPELESKVGEEAVKYSSQMNAIVQETVKSGMTTKEKARAIHDYMVKNYSYDYAAVKYPLKYAASYDFYGLLKNKKGVCQSFALLYAMLMQRAGVDCSTVSGVATESAGGREYQQHMWNVITLENGSKYYVDVTFDDSASSGSKVSTMFFYKSESRFYGFGYHNEY